VLRGDPLHPHVLGRRWIITVDRSNTGSSAEQSRLAGELAADLKEGVASGEPNTVALVEQLLNLAAGNGNSQSRRDPTDPGATAFLRSLFSTFVDELQSGRLRLSVEKSNSGSKPKPGIPPAPRSPPSPKETNETFFDVRYMDEIGLPLNGLPVVIVADGSAHPVKTNAAGVALLEHMKGASAIASIATLEGLETILDKRWVKPRVGTAPKLSNSMTLPFVWRDLPGMSLKAAVPHAVIITPPLGKLFVELREKTGRLLHAQREYRIEGPATFQGKTDDKGRLLHDQVFPGDYTLTLTIKAFEGDPDEVMEEVSSPLVVLAPSEGMPEQRRLGVLPISVLARLHRAFDTNRAFLLPTALPNVQRLRELYLNNSPCKLLVVGHADTQGGAQYNDKLSLARAKATLAFLNDDEGAWLAFYDKGIDEKQRWGKVEDHLMLRAMPDFGTRKVGEDPVEWYQRTRGLHVDGKAGTDTRTKLVKEYMGLDHATLQEAGKIEASAHGCGENFPLDEEEGELDDAPKDDNQDAGGRRVELFFFDSEFGILPPPKGDNCKSGSKEYPRWRERVMEVHDLTAPDPEGPSVIFVEMVDALFRTESAVVLPEGEAPSRDGKHEALSAVGIVATALRFNAEHPGKKVFVAGHTDSEGAEDYNQKLSAERAKATLALLTGGTEGREAWKGLCHARHKVSDYKQILAWVSQAFADLLFDCDPGKIDEVVGTGVEPVRRFQRAYNKNKKALGATEADLNPDGDVGKLTWGALFDCYEFALRQELGEEADGVKALRDKLVFADPARKSLGFGEAFPVEGLGRDHFRSQANRRSEILFFDPGEEPDLEHAEQDPGASELYLPLHFTRAPVPPLVSAKPWKAMWDRAAVPAKDQESRRMLVVAPGAPAGTDLAFEIEQLIEGTSSGALGTATSVSIENSGEGAFASWFNPDLTRNGGLLKSQQPFPKVSFRFAVSGGGRRVESDVLGYADFVEVTFKHEGTTLPIDKAPFTVLTPWGNRTGTTDEQGKARVDGLAPGGASVVLGDHRLVVGDVPKPGGNGAVPEHSTQRVVLRLVDNRFQPREDVPYTIVGHGGQLDPNAEPPVVLEGRTGTDGLIDEQIFTFVTSVTVRFDESTVDLVLEPLPPVDDLRGVQLRLINLGYDTKGTAGALDAPTESAIRQFRKERGLGAPAEGSGLLDAAFKKELEKAHES
jgi:outer membrane protein OmpA-like peptidoglycan-associated protein